MIYKICGNYPDYPTYSKSTIKNSLEKVCLINICDMGRYSPTRDWTIRAAENSNVFSMLAIFKKTLKTFNKNILEHYEIRIFIIRTFYI